jgi:uncharacterized protein (TIGR02145 family)
LNNNNKTHIKASKIKILKSMKITTLILTIALMIFAMDSFAQAKKPPVKKTTKKTTVKKKAPVKKPTTVKEVEIPGTGTVKDVRDGKVYKTIKIGTQTWLAENMAYNAGDGCWAYNNDVNNIKKYGYLYDWKTAKKAGALTGWHLPTDADWITLITYLGGMYEAGGKLKKTGATGYWTSPNTGATNASGFSAVPGGCRAFMGKFDDVGAVGYYWTSTDVNTIVAYYYFINNNSGTISKTSGDKVNGYAVRCVKNQ